MSDSTHRHATELDPACDTAEQLQLAVAAAAALGERVALLGDGYQDVFLAHVADSVPHYRALAGQGRRLGSLGDFPVVDRATMTADPPAFFSDRFSQGRLDRARSWIMTNGTLSPKFKVHFDPAAFYDLLYFAPALVLSSVPGLVDRLWASDPALPQVHSIHDEGAGAVARNPSLGGASVRYSVIGQGADRDAAVARLLRAGPTAAVMGSPHVLVQLARIDDELGGPGERIRPEVIVASGEPLYPSYRRRLASHFGCRVIDAYAATEAGLIAVDCERGAGLHVQTDRVVIEIESDAGELAAEGTGRFVLTNMMNWAQPFVRYRLGDRGQQRWVDCPCGFAGPTLTVASREVASYYVPGAGTIDARALAEVLDRPAVEHFQVAQDPDRRLWIRWTPAAARHHDTPADTAAALARGLRALVGSAFRLEQCDAIAVPGGKLLRFVDAPRSEHVPIA